MTHQHLYPGSVVSVAHLFRSQLAQRPGNAGLAQVAFSGSFFSTCSSRPTRFKKPILVIHCHNEPLFYAPDKVLFWVLLCLLVCLTHFLRGKSKILTR
jgi:hypothetical protein